MGEGLGCWNETAASIAAACTIVYLGADLLDDVADDDLIDEWSSVGPSGASLAGATYLASLVGLMLDTMRSHGTDERTLWSLSTRFSGGLLEMSAGQHQDLSPDPPTDLDACLSTTRLKTGAEFGLFAHTAAALATDDQGVLSSAEEFGRCLGTAFQLASDVYDIWRGPAQDLITGKRTLPIVHALEHLDDGDRERLETALLDGRSSAAARSDAKKLMLQAGSISYVAVVIEVQRQKGLRLLADLPLEAEERENLQELMDQASPFAMRPRLGG